MTCLYDVLCAYHPESLVRVAWFQGTGFEFVEASKSLHRVGPELVAVRTEPASTPPGDRQLRVYEITEAGKMRYRVLMMDTTLNPGE